MTTINALLNNQKINITEALDHSFRVFGTHRSLVRAAITISFSDEFQVHDFVDGTEIGHESFLIVARRDVN